MRLKARRPNGRPVGLKAETVREMTQLRQELAKELEANLKQLRIVIEDSQRIARELEAVLHQTRLAPVEVPSLSTGRQGRFGQAQHEHGRERQEKENGSEARVQGAPGLPGSS